MKNIVTIGGGHGHAQVLKALKDIPDIKITGLCPNTDSGGSTGILQRSYDGSGYTGDLTRCVVALCNDDVLAKALSYRYGTGPLNSHLVRNLLFHALEKVSGPRGALESMWNMCGLGRHRVLPVTSEKTELCASLKIGNTIIGETNIDEIAKNPLWNPEVHSISDIYLKPKVRAASSALEAIAQAEYVVVSPGDLYSSLIPTLLPRGVQQSIQKTSAKIILIINIMTKKGETDNYTALDFIEKIEKYLGRKADHIICNSAPIPNEIILKYSLEQKSELHAPKNHRDSRILSVPLVMVSESDQQILTDPMMLRKTIQKILRK